MSSGWSVWFENFYNLIYFVAPWMYQKCRFSSDRFLVFQNRKFFVM
ncbi:hypothetical Protein YC6258_05130 [Gynuella sunshinyii YC6258]|uniref:Uncharacterized protein n=1 Tax=Gynuella sunshinyii YC6258 TaxID=1445510 RepID=A0A0C5VCU7_9GAMM|nr:hypothetical Protein YC6258_05130 [Gynuella sunshinyii YC6258]